MAEENQKTEKKVVKKKKKKKRSLVTQGRVYITATYNNTIDYVCIVDSRSIFQARGY